MNPIDLRDLNAEVHPKLEKRKMSAARTVTARLIRARDRTLNHVKTKRVRFHYVISRRENCLLVTSNAARKRGFSQISNASVMDLRTSAIRFSNKN